MDVLLHSGAFALITLLLAALFASLFIFSSYFQRQFDAESTVPGCRRFGLVGKSNMADQYSHEHNGENLKSAAACRIKALFIYPIKSCKPVEIDHDDVILTGLRYDRQFCFAQLKTEEAEKEEGDLSVGTKWVHNWKFITQRNVPRLSQVDVKVWVPDPSSPSYSPEAEWVRSKGCIVCSFAFTPEWSWNLEGLKTAFSLLKTKVAQRDIRAEPRITFKLPIAPDEKRSQKYSREVMKIWKCSPMAINITSEIPTDTLAKLKYFLGVSNPLALFMADPLNHRQVFRNAPTAEEAGYQPGVGFADAYPLSIMGIASVQKVSKTITNLPTPHLDALRFRANIYLTGIHPFAEDDWKIIRSGNLDYHVSCRTTRCDLPNVDPDTGIKDRAEPYKTLKQTRGNIDKGAGAHPVLGMQMVPLLKDANGSEEIRVGAEMKVVQTGEHFYIKLFQD
ncbi:hypothetical protein QM012_004621 [Aureobasidium pullulans]|uniref:MOSC domain-containing protein n=1 Tax=Aureobasidium pullulans TaxID=5580 RepID=A0ABR0TUP0_AURPU